MLIASVDWIRKIRRPRVVPGLAEAALLNLKFKVAPDPELATDAIGPAVVVVFPVAGATTPPNPGRVITMPPPGPPMPPNPAVVPE